MDERGRLKIGLRATWAGLFINLLLVWLKLAIGFLGRSQALVADGLHSLSDLFSDVVVLVGLKLGRAPADRRHPFGHGRMETLASLAVGLALAGGAVLIALEALESLRCDPLPDPTWLAPLAALVSLGLKEFLFRYTRRVARLINSSVLEANAWHHRSDALSSVAVLIGAGAAALNPAWSRADAYAAVAVSALVLWAGIRVIWDALKELSDTAPAPEVLDNIIGCARGVEGVYDVHDVKVRVSGGRYLMELHVEVDGGIPVRQGHEIAKRVEKCLHDEIKLIQQVSIHVDPYDANGGGSGSSTAKEEIDERSA